MKAHFIVDNSTLGITVREFIMIGNVIDVVCEGFRITKEDFKSHHRFRPMVYARCAFSVILYNIYNGYRRNSNLSNISYMVIGSFMGSKDHATISNYITKIHPSLMNTAAPGYYEQYMACEGICKTILTNGTSSLVDRLKEINIMMKALGEERHEILQQLETLKTENKNGPEQTSERSGA